MKEEASFSLPGCPPSWPNRRLNHYVRHRQMREWKDTTRLVAQSARVAAGWGLPIRIRPPPSTPRWVQFVLRRHRLLDPDNATASIKPLLDGLVGALLVDDGPQWCDLVVLQSRIRPSEPESTLVRVRLAGFSAPK